MRLRRWVGVMVCSGVGLGRGYGGVRLGIVFDNHESLVRISNDQRSHTLLSQISQFRYYICSSHRGVLCQLDRFVTQYACNNAAVSKTFRFS